MKHFSTIFLWRSFGILRYFDRNFSFNVIAWHQLDLNYNQLKAQLPAQGMAENLLIYPKNHLFVKFLKSSATARSLEALRGVELRCYILKLIGRRLATEDIRLTGPIIFLSMSSSDLPCVSGTQNIWMRKSHFKSFRKRKYYLKTYHKD